MKLYTALIILAGVVPSLVVAQQDKASAKWVMAQSNTSWSFGASYAMNYNYRLSYPLTSGSSQKVVADSVEIPALGGGLELIASRNWSNWGISFSIAYARMGFKTPPLKGPNSYNSWLLGGSGAGVDYSETTISYDVLSFPVRVRHYIPKSNRFFIELGGGYALRLRRKEVAQIIFLDGTPRNPPITHLRSTTKSGLLLSAGVGLQVGSLENRLKLSLVPTCQLLTGNRFYAEFSAGAYYKPYVLGGLIRVEWGD